MLLILLLSIGIEGGGAGKGCGSVGRRLREYEEEYGVTGRAVVYVCTRALMCGGWGDRFAGIAGSLSFALLTHRAFFILDPSLSLYFRSPFYRWEYTPANVGRHYVDVEVVVGMKMLLKVLHRPKFDPSSWNRTDLTNQNQVYLLNNRGPMHLAIREIAITHGLSSPNTEANETLPQARSRRMNAFYQCVLSSLFKPTPLLTSLEVDFFGHERVIFRELEGLLAGYFVIAMHFRNHDHVFASSLSIPPGALRCLSDVMAAHRHAIGDKKVAVVISSNIVANSSWVFSPPDVPGVATFFFRKRALYEQTHIQVVQVHNGTPHAIDVSFGYLLVDWFLLKFADILVMSVYSGFSASAAAVGNHAGIYLLSPDSCSRFDVIPCAIRLCA
jgi:hypothetical protein